MSPSLWPPERARAAVAHSIVNGLGVLTLGAMHVWGSLSAEWAAGGILVLCGIWAGATHKGPPPGPPGAAGLVVLAGKLAGSILPHVRH